MEKGVKPRPIAVYNHTFSDVDKSNYEQTQGGIVNKFPLRGGDASAWEDVWLRNYFHNLRVVVAVERAKELSFYDVMVEACDGLIDWALSGGAFKELDISKHTWEECACSECAADAKED